MDPIKLLQSLYEEMGLLRKTVIQMQQELIELRTENQTLATEIREQKANYASVPYRRLTYNIQNLNVKTLSGTLNVGLVTGTTPEEVKDQLASMGVEMDEEAEGENVQGTTSGDSNTSFASTAAQTNSSQNAAR